MLRCFQVGTLNSVFSKAVPPQLVSQVLAVVMSVGTLGRIAGPLWGGNASYDHGIVWWGMLVVIVAGAVWFAAEFRVVGAPALPAAPVAPLAAPPSPVPVAVVSSPSGSAQLQMELSFRSSAEVSGTLTQPLLAFAGEGDGRSDDEA